MKPARAPADVAAVREGFDVFAEATRLGAVLMQFPFSFHNTPENFARLETLAQEFCRPTRWSSKCGIRAGWINHFSIGCVRPGRILQYRPARDRKIREADRPRHFAHRLCSAAWPPLRYVVYR